MNKSNATGKAQASQDKTSKPSADKAKPGDAKKAEAAPIQGSLIPGTSVIMPFREGYDPNKATKPSQPKQPDPSGNKAAAQPQKTAAAKKSAASSADPSKLSMADMMKKLE